VSKKDDIDDPYWRFSEKMLLVSAEIRSCNLPTHCLIPKKPKLFAFASHLDIYATSSCCT